MKKNLQNLKWKWQRKLKRSINKKSPNLEGTVEENRKIVDLLMLRVPGRTLRMSGMYQWKKPLLKLVKNL